MNRKQSILFLAISAIIVSGCVEPLEINACWDKPPIVVQCILTRDTVQTVKLYYAAEASQETFKAVEEADVSVRRVSEFGKTFEFEYASNGEWTAKFKPDYDYEYELQVKVPGYELITARTTMPENLGVFTLGPHFTTYFPDKFEPLFAEAGLISAREEMGGPVIGYVRYYNDVPLKKDVYIWIRHSRGCDLATDHLYADDFNVTSRLYSSDLFSQEDLSDSTQYNRKGIVPCCYGLPLHKGFLRIVNPADYCRGIPGRYGEFGHDENGNVVVKVAHYYDRYFVLLGDFTYNKKEFNGDCLESRIVSKELDRYYRDVYSYQNTNMDDILNMIYASDAVSSNVVNGSGVFGAEIISTVSVDHPFMLFDK